MDFDIKFEGLDGIIKKIDKIDDVQPLTQAMYDAVDIVEESAKHKAPKGVTGQLEQEIKNKVEVIGTEIVGTVFNELEYAPYLEYGTGAFRESNPTNGYWIYVGDKDYKPNSKKSTKRYTLEEAKQIVAIMRKKGLEAYYTNGQHPQPFMRPALEENKDKIRKIFKEALK